MPTHTRDSDCTLDPLTDTCHDCGVHHGEPCPECEGRGFHAPKCRELRPLAHAVKVRRITMRAARRVLALRDYCEGCGAATLNVAFYADGNYVEACSACLGDANRRVNDDDESR